MMTCSIETCKNPGSPYCRTHYKYSVKDDLERSGKRICSNFRRGCVKEVTDEKYKTCVECNEKAKKLREKKKNDKEKCKIEKCSSPGNPYCKAHKKYLIKDKLDEEGKFVCSNFSRGCSNESQQNEKCSSCRTKVRASIADKKLKVKDKNSCRRCYKEFEPFLTERNNNSSLCKTCSPKEMENIKSKQKNKIKKLEKLHSENKNACTRCFVEFEPFYNKHNKLSSSCRDCLDKGVKYLISSSSKKRLEGPICSSCKNPFEDVVTNMKTCVKCRDRDKSYTDKKKEIIKNTPGNPCKKCGKQFKPFLTNVDKQSTKCIHCLNVCRVIESRRGKRTNKSTDWKMVKITDIERYNRHLEWKKKYNSIKRHYEEYRAKQIQEKGYLVYRQEQTLRMKTYRKNNKPRFLTALKKQRDDVNYKHGQYKLKAIRRGLEFLLPKEKTKELFTSNCFYCNELENINGIDRFYNDIGYTIENSVSCCSKCNYIKTCLDPKVFIYNCKKILIHNNIIAGKEKEKNFNSNTNPKNIYYSKYQVSAKERNKDFLLSKEEFTILTNGDCYLCGRQNSSEHKNGIDRVDSDIGYNKENCKTCCGTCNFMKNNSNLDEFLKHLQKIINHSNLDHIKDKENPQTRSIIKSNNVKMTSLEIQKEAQIREEKLNSHAQQKFNDKAVKENKEEKERKYKEYKRTIQN